MFDALHVIPGHSPRRQVAVTYVWLVGMPIFKRFLSKYPQNYLRKFKVLQNLSQGISWETSRISENSLGKGVPKASQKLSSHTLNWFFGSRKIHSRTIGNFFSHYFLSQHFFGTSKSLICKIQKEKKPETSKSDLFGQKYTGNPKVSRDRRRKAVHFFRDRCRKEVQEFLEIVAEKKFKNF